MFKKSLNQWTGVDWLKAGLVGIFIVGTIIAFFDSLTAQLFLTTLALFFATMGFTICFTQREAENKYTSFYSHVGMALCLVSFILAWMAIYDNLAHVWENRILGLGYFAAAAALFHGFRHFALKKSWGYFSDHNWRYEALFYVLNLSAAILTWVTYHGMPKSIWGSQFIQIVGVVLGLIMANIFILQFANDKRQKESPKLSKVARYLAIAMRGVAAFFVLSILNQNFDWITHEITRSIAILIVSGICFAICFSVTKNKNHKLTRMLSGAGLVAVIISAVFFFALTWKLAWLKDLFDPLGDHVLSIITFAVAASASSLLYQINRESRARFFASGFAYLLSFVIISTISGSKLPGDFIGSMIVMCLLGYSISALILILSPSKK